MKKKILLCFGENFSEQAAFGEFSDRAAGFGFETHLFDGAVSGQLRLTPHGLFDLLVHVWKEAVDENEYFFLTDDRNFFKLTYRVFQQTFRQFVFWAGAEPDVYEAELDDVYLAMLAAPVRTEENLFKTVFVSNLSAVSGEDFYGARIEGVDGFFTAEEPENRRLRQNIYRCEQECYLLEPAIGAVNYIDLDGQAVDARTKFSDIVTPVELDKKLIKQAEEILELIFRNADRVMRRKEVAHKLFSLLQAALLSGGVAQQKYGAALIAAMGEGYGLYAQIYVLSFLLQTFKTSAVYKYLLDICIKSDQLSAQNKYYVFCQSRYVDLVDRAENEAGVFRLEIAILAQVSSELEKLSSDALKNLGGEEADIDCVLVLAGQFLNYAHPVSKFSLDICRFLTIGGSHVTVYEASPMKCFEKLLLVHKHIRKLF